MAIECEHGHLARSCNICEYEKEIAELEEKIEKRDKALEQYRRWTNDLQSGMYVNCVYCGHQYGPRKDTPVAMADVLRKHIEQCPEHPLSAAKAEIQKRDKEIAGWKEAREHDLKLLGERNKEITKLKAEVKRLRDALRNIIETEQRVFGTPSDVMEIAQAALLKGG